ncbi:hypothetical protein K440DRAFT_644025 [Wilcoxina mikolae CBS 423.85]|nr:hypothetical protein K440DRAFT_644025 [Wilcoxina mikolae CBS 423.85]
MASRPGPLVPGAEHPEPDVVLRSGSITGAFGPRSGKASAIPPNDVESVNRFRTSALTTESLEYRSRALKASRGRFEPLLRKPRIEIRTNRERTYERGCDVPDAFGTHPGPQRYLTTDAQSLPDRDDTVGGATHSFRDTTMSLSEERRVWNDSHSIQLIDVDSARTRKRRAHNLMKPRKE